MNWAIKDEYFEKIYGKSHKPKGRAGQRRVRSAEAQQPAETDADTTCGDSVRDSAEDIEELQSKLFSDPEGPDYSIWPKDL